MENLIPDFNGKPDPLAEVFDLAWPGLACGRGAELNLGQPLPTAAFSRRDLLLPGYPSADAAVRHASSRQPSAP